MRAAVLGAAGIIGKGIARRLAATESWDLLLADRREGDLKELGRELERETAGVDVRDPEATSRALRGCDLVVNATWYYFNLEVMDAALRAGSDYLDLGGLYHTTRKQLGLAKQFEGADRVAVLGCGKAPGITNILAAAAAPRFDALKAVRLRSGRRPLEETTGFRLPYSPQTLIDEMTLRPVVLKGGRLREIEPLARRETVRHPEPFGPIDYLATLHSELATLPGYLGRGLQEMDFQVALAPDTVRALETLIALGLTSSDPVTVEGTRVVPRDYTVAMLLSLPQAKGREVWITEAEMHGSKEGRPLTVTMRVTGDETQNGTSLGASVAASLMGRGAVRARGVHAPETALPADTYLNELASTTGMRVTEDVVQGRGWAA